jgi:hypothetical protein
LDNELIRRLVLCALPWFGITLASIVAALFLFGITSHVGRFAHKVLAQNKCCIALPNNGLAATFFGMTQTQTGGVQNPTINVPVMRLWDTNVAGTVACPWPGIETSAGVYNFTNCDTFTDLAAANSGKWSWVAGRTPSFYIQTPANCNGTYHPNGCAQLTNDLNTTNTALPNFITALVNHWVSRYPTIHGNFIEGLNEADLANECANQAFTTNCTMADLVKYNTTIKTAAQTADPTIIMIGPPASTFNSSGPHLYGPAAGNTPGPGSGYLQQAGAAASMDAIGLHPYSFCGTPVNCPTVASLQASFNAAASLFASFGLSAKPVYYTEVNWGTGTANSGMTDNQRIAWDLSFDIMAWNSGAAGVWDYQWSCPSGTLSGCFGTRNGSGVGVAVATALATIQTWMIGSKMSPGSCNQNVDGHSTWSCPFVNPSGASATFVFNITGNQTITVSSAYTTQFFSDGTNSAIVANQVVAGTIPSMVQ